MSDCPACDLQERELPVRQIPFKGELKTQYAVNIIDKADGKVKQMWIPPSFLKELQKRHAFDMSEEDRSETIITIAKERKDNAERWNNRYSFKDRGDLKLRFLSPSDILEQELKSMI